ncbi:SDR family NAD(P)-dependent oxidoreductase [Shewanella litorisediminis]|uniref:SDR family NAD(P)-dependent oxidoreductase n=1 Tax=Shewanella litorisediminis TaxID=1173586 RepID=A0ABX7G6Y7_9GAMM|nr:SDR family NAD(P)-dependent oxidoreductase [Shewanella litorisediminis]MCL2916734.1 SDR family NAD(P)-dependent oxidoreductase [Shewanella litorisediminis]QRH03096.1 SDR family NAD(P)-dependent oxidoreductase [Shewanella litorisediminis]
MTQATAIIVGASSHLGRELVTQLTQEGTRVGLLVPEPELMTEFIQSLGGDIQVEALPITDPDGAMAAFESLWQRMGGAHLVLVNTGLNSYHPDLPWQIEADIIKVNVQGFALICNTAFRLLRQQGYGQLAAINSIAGQRGGPAVAYHASKAFAQNYLEGLSMHAQRLKLPITITDLQLGLLDKAAMQQSRFWLQPLPKVAAQILRALKKGKRRAYITRRWALVAWLIRILPEYIYNTRHWKKKGKH